MCRQCMAPGRRVVGRTRGPASSVDRDRKNYRRELLNLSNTVRDAMERPT